MGFGLVAAYRSPCSAPRPLRAPFVFRLFDAWMWVLVLPGTKALETSALTHAKVTLAMQIRSQYVPYLPVCLFCQPFVSPSAILRRVFFFRLPRLLLGGSFGRLVIDRRPVVIICIIMTQTLRVGVAWTWLSCRDSKGG